MANKHHLQLLRGSQRSADKYTGKVGELVFDTTNNQLRVHDGHTVGGHTIANVSNIQGNLGGAKISNFVNDAGYVKKTEVINKADSANKDGQGNVIADTYLKKNLDGSAKVTTIANKGDSSDAIATTKWVNQAESVVHTFGNETVNGTKTFTSDIVGTCVKAKWADVAEYYIGDRIYEKGTIVKLGGVEEVTIANNRDPDEHAVLAVVSDEPGFVINNETTSHPNAVPIVLSGRSAIKVVGPINKFDKIVLSDIDGVGRKYDYKCDQPHKIVGVALQTISQKENQISPCISTIVLSIN